MSIRVDTSPLISGAVVVGVPGLGVLAESVPSTGEHGAGYLYDSLEFPADNGKEVRGLITTWPTLGTLTTFEDSSFEYDGPTDSFAFQMYVDGVAVGTPQTVTVTVGAAVTLMGASTTQTSQTTIGAIGGQGSLSGASTTQTASATSGQVLSTHILVAAAVAADAQASASAVVQVHLLSGNNVIQVASSTAEATDLTSTHNLGGATTTQASSTTVGAILQEYVLGGATTTSNAVASIGVITQQHMLLGVAVIQGASSTSGATYTGVQPYSISLNRVIAVRRGGLRDRVHRVSG